MTYEQRQVSAAKVNQPRFSSNLKVWLDSPRPKTLQGLAEEFGEKSFAIIFVILMAVPALPVPTGGLTHVFEIIVALLAMEMIIGRQSLWLPKRWRDLSLSPKFQKNTLPKLLDFMDRVQHFSRPRWQHIVKNPLSHRLMGWFVLLMTAFAFFAPPFSGLDTLPSMGVVLVSLAVLFEDILLTIVGTLIGLVGVGLVLALGTFVLRFF